MQRISNRGLITKLQTLIFSLSHSCTAHFLKLLLKPLVFSADCFCAHLVGTQPMAIHLPPLQLFFSLTEHFVTGNIFPGNCPPPTDPSAVVVVRLPRLPSQPAEEQADWCCSSSRFVAAYYYFYSEFICSSSILLLL